MLFADHLTLDAPKRTSDGYLAVRANAARAGVQDYLGIEVDLEGKRFAADEVVPVYRPADEVFAERSVHSFLMKPITDDHPRQAVTAANCKDHARGTVAKAMRDGDHLAFDLIFMDQAAISQVDAGKRELSNGYSCELEFGDGVAPDGTAYKATQRNIIGNHVALALRPGWPDLPRWRRRPLRNHSLQPVRPPEDGEARKDHAHRRADRRHRQRRAARDRRRRGSCRC